MKIRVRSYLFNDDNLVSNDSRKIKNSSQEIYLFWKIHIESDNTFLTLVVENQSVINWVENKDMNQKLGDTIYKVSL